MAYAWRKNGGQASRVSGSRRSMNFVGCFRRFLNKIYFSWFPSPPSPWRLIKKNIENTSFDNNRPKASRQRTRNIIKLHYYSSEKTETRRVWNTKTHKMAVSIRWWMETPWKRITFFVLTHRAARHVFFSTFSLYEFPKLRRGFFDANNEREDAENEGENRRILHLSFCVVNSDIFITIPFHSFD